METKRSSVWDYPLWLPPGSVRAIITLTLLGSAIYFIVAGFAVPEWLQALVTAAIGFYVGTRSINGDNGKR